MGLIAINLGGIVLTTQNQTIMAKVRANIRLSASLIGSERGGSLTPLLRIVPGPNIGAKLIHSLMTLTSETGQTAEISKTGDHQAISAKLVIA